MLGINKDLAAMACQGRSIIVGLIGAGQMGTDIVSQVADMQGMAITAVADLAIERAIAAYTIAGYALEQVTVVATLAEAVAARAEGKLIATADYRIVTDLAEIEAVIESTGSPEVGARAALRTLKQQKHLVMMNVEADITVGPILKWYADYRGVVYTLGAGDEPAALQDLYDFASALGLTVVAAGKGKNNPLDRYATPAQQAQEAARRGLTPEMLVEFVDGSKTMIEMAAVANATGLTVDIRGMHGPLTTRPQLKDVFSLKSQGGVLKRAGVVDYAIGDVAPGVFLVVTTENPRLREALVLRDMGLGPNYMLFRPFHLCSMEVPLSAARAVIHRRTTMEPLSKLVTEVFAVAKADLEPGTILDGIGGRHFYSLIDTATTAAAEGLLPVGLAKGATVLRPVERDQPLTYDMVVLREPSTVLALRRLQDAWGAGTLQDDLLPARIEALIAEN